MKFKVRKGYIVHLEQRNEMPDGQIEITTSTITPEKVFDLTADQADLHTHKLEPVDKEASAYLASKVRADVAPANAVDPDALAAAVANVLASMGIVPPEKVAAA